MALLLIIFVMPVQQFDQLKKLSGAPFESGVPTLHLWLLPFL